MSQIHHFKSYYEKLLLTFSYLSPRKLRTMMSETYILYVKTPVSCSKCICPTQWATKPTTVCTGICKIVMLNKIAKIFVSQSYPDPAELLKSVGWGKKQGHISILGQVTLNKNYLNNLFGARLTMTDQPFVYKGDFNQTLLLSFLHGHLVGVLLIMRS